MRKDDNGLRDALANIMGSAAGVQETHNGGTRDPQETHNGGTADVQKKAVARDPVKYSNVTNVTKLEKAVARDPVKVRFDAGDYSKLQDIARREGTTAAALIRRAVKELIRRGGK